MLQAGNISFHLTAWEKLTQDVFVLQAVKGYRLVFVRQPVQITPRVTSSTTIAHDLVISQEVSSMLTKGSIEMVNFHPSEFVSSIFLVPKKYGQLRPIINLKPLNQFVKKIHFKMETVESVFPMLRQGDYMGSIDLKDAYFSVPIARDHRKFLRFIWENQRYQFTCLPFGLSSSPRVFTKVLRPVVAALRHQGIRMVIYLDDLLVMASSKNECSKHLMMAVKLLQSLGFVINKEKSLLIPTQQIEFLGYVLSSTSMQVRISHQKCATIVQKCKDVLHRSTLSIREVASIVGLLKSVIHAIMPSAMFCRHLQLCQIAALKKAELGFEGTMTLPLKAKEELNLWIQHLQVWNGRPMFPPPVNFVVQTDASLKGWGGACFKDRRYQVVGCRKRQSCI
jgi:hypothetical protein